MGDFEAKGDEFAKKADKKLKSFSLFGSSTKYEDGAELLDKAANQYKLGKACKFDIKFRLRSSLVIIVRHFSSNAFLAEHAIFLCTRH